MKNKLFLFLGAFLFFALGILLLSIPAKADDKMPAEVKTCLQQKLGAEAYEAIVNGDRDPSEAEKKNGEGCFTGLIKQNKNAKVKGDVKSCIKKAIGKSLEEIDNPTPDQIEKIDACFGKDKGGAIAFPDETKACVKSVVGEARMNEIMSGQKPTATEKAAIGPKCFGMKGGGSNQKEMPAEAKACFTATFGKSPEEMGPLTEDQRKTLDEKCFGGQQRQNFEKGMNGMTDAEKACFQSLIGKPLDQAGPLTADQERQVGEKCFANRQQGQSPSSSGGFTETERACVRSAIGRDIAGVEQATDAEKQLLGRCFGSAQSGPPTTAGSGSESPLVNQQSDPAPNPFASLKTETQQCIASALGLTVETLGNGNYNDPATEQKVVTCKNQHGDN